MSVFVLIMTTPNWTCFNLRYNNQPSIYCTFILYELTRGSKGQIWILIWRRCHRAMIKVTHFHDLINTSCVEIPSFIKWIFNLEPNASIFREHVNEFSWKAHSKHTRTNQLAKSLEIKAIALETKMKWKLYVKNCKYELLIEDCIEFNRFSIS